MRDLKHFSDEEVSLDDTKSWKDTTLKFKNFVKENLEKLLTGLTEVSISDFITRQFLDVFF